MLLQQPGFRPKEIILVTTLVDSKRYPKAKLAQLYQLRWQATEVNFKHLKTTLKMEMIFAKTPEMVQKEIWMHLLAYNLLRTLMWQSAQQSEVSPLRMSLQGTRQQFNQFRPDERSSNGQKSSSPLHYPARCHQ
jgi:IS4 transposase